MTTPYYKKTVTKSGDTVSYSESTRRSNIGLLNNIYVGCYCLGFKIQIVIHSPFFM